MIYVPILSPPSFRPATPPVPLSLSFSSNSRGQISLGVATIDGQNGLTQPLMSSLLSLQQLELVLVWYVQGHALI
jgi:hypothetical protein